MEKIERQKREVDIVVDVFCDLCGKSCKIEGMGNFEFMELRAVWGYDSTHDDEEWTAQICNACVDERFKDINFEKRQLNFGSSPTKEEERKWKLSNDLYRSKEEDK